MQYGLDTLILTGGKRSAGGGGGGGVVVPLTQKRLHFYAGASIWKYRGATSFSIVDDMKHGRIEKVRTYLRWLRTLGINIVRGFASWRNLGLRPDLAAVRATLLLCKEEGFHVHLTCLCDQVDGSPVRVSKTEQLAFLRGCIALAAEIGNAIIEEFNEFEKNDDDRVCGALTPSDYGDALGTRSWWGENRHFLNAGTLLRWTTGHTNRDREHARTMVQALDVQRRGYSFKEGGIEVQVPPTGLPHVHGEPDRILASGHTKRQAADFQAGSLLFGAGACMHGDWKGSREPGSDLQNCEIPTGEALKCCEAIGAVHRAHAAGLWPPNTPDGNYIRGGVNGRNEDNKPDCPILHRDRYFGGSNERPAYDEDEGAARSFFMELGGKYYGLAVDPGPQWTLKVRSGFRLVAQGGYEGNMLVLEAA